MPSNIVVGPIANWVGQQSTTAQSALETQGAKVVLNYQYAPLVPFGEVISQQVTAIPFGTQVTLTVSGTIAPVIDAKVINVSRVPNAPWFSNPAPPVDLVPDAFAFDAIPNATIGGVTESASVMVTGITAGQTIPISVSGDGTPQYQINGGAWTSSAGFVELNNTVKVRLTAAATGGVTRNATLNMGGITGTFSVTTNPGAPAVMAIDTGTTITSHPAALDGFNFIRIFETHQEVYAGIINFTLGSNALIYYAHDDTNNVKPPFLTSANGWTDSGLTIATSDGLTRELWKKNVTAGTPENITFLAANVNQRGAYKIGAFFIPSGVALTARTPLSYELCSLDNYTPAPSDKFLWTDPPATNALTATATPSSTSAIQTALNNAGPGSVIKVANSTYTGSVLTMTGRNGTAANPIIICPATLGSANFGVGVTIRFTNCSYVIFTGFKFLSTNTTNNKVDVEANCSFVRVTNNFFDQCNSSIAGTSPNMDHWIILEGKYCRSDHNTMTGKTSRGNCVRNAPISATVHPFGCIVDHNLCTGQVAFDSDSEAMQFGGNQDQNADILTLSHHNEFRNFEWQSVESEVHTTKSNVITYWANIYTNCQGYVVLRHCSNVFGLANKFFAGTSGNFGGGFNVHGGESGGHHVLALNYFDSIGQDNFDARACFNFSEDDDTDYFHTEDILIVGNVARDTVKFIRFAGVRTNGTDPERIWFMGNAALCSGSFDAIVDELNVIPALTFSGNVVGPVRGTAWPGGQAGVTQATLTFTDPNADGIYTTSHANISPGINTQWPAVVEAGTTLGALVGKTW